MAGRDEAIRVVKHLLNCLEATNPNTDISWPLVIKHGYSALEEVVDKEPPAASTVAPGQEGSAGGGSSDEGGENLASERTRPEPTEFLGSGSTASNGAALGREVTGEAPKPQAHGGVEIHGSCSNDAAPRQEQPHGRSGAANGDSTRPELEAACPAETEILHDWEDGVLILRPTKDQWEDFPALLNTAHEHGAPQAGVFKVDLGHLATTALSGQSFVRKPVACSEFVSSTELCDGVWHVKTVPRQRKLEWQDHPNDPPPPPVEELVQSHDDMLRGSLSDVYYRTDMPAQSAEERLAVGLPPESSIWPLPGNRLDETEHAVPGIHSPYFYQSHSSPGAMFLLHVEDFSLYSLNILHAGRKVWVCIPPSAQASLEECLKRSVHSIERTCAQCIRHEALFVSPEKLRKWQIPFKIVDQRQGQVVVTLPHTYHQGFCGGSTVAEAVNYAGPEWSPDGYCACDASCPKPTIQAHLMAFRAPGGEDGRQTGVQVRRPHQSSGKSSMDRHKAAEVQKNARKVQDGVQKKVQKLQKAQKAQKVQTRPQIKPRTRLQTEVQTGPQTGLQKNALEISSRHDDDTPLGAPALRGDMTDMMKLINMPTNHGIVDRSTALFSSQEEGLRSSTDRCSDTHTCLYTELPSKCRDALEDSSNIDMERKARILQMVMQCSSPTPDAALAKQAGRNVTSPEAIMTRIAQDQQQIHLWTTSMRLHLIQLACLFIDYYADFQKQMKDRLYLKKREHKNMEHKKKVANCDKKTRGRSAESLAYDAILSSKVSMELTDLKLFVKWGIRLAFIGYNLNYNVISTIPSNIVSFDNITLKFNEAKLCFPALAKPIQPSEYHELMQDELQYFITWLPKLRPDLGSQTPSTRSSSDNTIRKILQGKRAWGLPDGNADVKKRRLN